MAGDMAKLRELMLYIATKTEKSARFGSIKLNKALFYSDFLWYAKTGASITGISYQKMDFGPAPCGLLPVQETLEREGAVLVERRNVFPNRIEKRLIAKRKADLSIFKSEEIAFVDEVVDWLGPDSSAKDVSEATHNQLGWLLAEYTEQIPYETVFLDDSVAQPSDVKRGLELAQERGWFKPLATAP